MPGIYRRLRQAARRILLMLPPLRGSLIPIVIPSTPAEPPRGSSPAELVPTTCSLCGPGTSHTTLDPAPPALGAPARLVRCDRCGHVRLSHRPGSVQSTHSFTLDYLENCALAEYERCGSLVRVGGRLLLFPLGNRRFFRSVLDAVRPYRRTGRIVDCGCGAGFLVEALRREGWIAVGVEVSPLLVACGRASFDADLRVADFGALEGFDDLDAVTLIEVIEHLFDPLPVLRQLRAWLRPGGALYLTTPNFDCTDRIRAGMGWETICADHYQYFTSATLRRALEAAGLEPRLLAEVGATGAPERGGRTLRCCAVNPGPASHEPGTRR